MSITKTKTMAFQGGNPVRSKIVVLQYCSGIGWKDKLLLERCEHNQGIQHIYGIIQIL